MKRVAVCMSEQLYERLREQAFAGRTKMSRLLLDAWISAKPVIPDQLASAVPNKPEVPPGLEASLLLGPGKRGEAEPKTPCISGCGYVGNDFMARAQGLHHSRDCSLYTDRDLAP